MDRQNNEQNTQQNTNQSQQNTNQSQQNTSQSQNGGFPGFFFPLNFVFRERQQDQTSDSQNGSQGQQPQQQIPQIQFFIHPTPSTQGGDNATTPGIFFFTPFFMPQEEVRKPRASESAMKRLPIVAITKEHVDSHAGCPICLEPFSQEENKTITEHESVRQMPCNHMFCESCLFQWLRQNNSCPLCRKEIEAEGAGTQQQEPAANMSPNIPLFGMINVTNPPTTTPTTTSNDTSPNANANTHSHSHSHSPHRSTVSCALASVGCCEEIDNNDTPAPIITLPQCHHRFHASCLRTSLLVEGYPPDDFNLISRPRSLNFHCPTCRAPAIVQNDVLKMPAVPRDERQQEQQGIPFNLPLTIHIPDSDDMDLD